MFNVFLIHSFRLIPRKWIGVVAYEDKTQPDLDGVMPAPDGSDCPCQGIHTEIARPGRLVVTNTTLLAGC